MKTQTQSVPVLRVINPKRNIIAWRNAMRIVSHQGKDFLVEFSEMTHKTLVSQGYLDY